jgi:hypothetical protein
MDEKSKKQFRRFMQAVERSKPITDTIKGLTDRAQPITDFAELMTPGNVEPPPPSSPAAEPGNAETQRPGLPQRRRRGRTLAYVPTAMDALIEANQKVSNKRLAQLYTETQGSQIGESLAKTARYRYRHFGTSAKTKASDE